MAKSTVLKSIFGPLPGATPVNPLIVLIVLGPPVCLMAFWLGGERLLILAALAFPTLSVLSLIVPLVSHDTKRPEMSELAFETRAGRYLAAARENGTKTAVFFLEIDEFQQLRDHYGEAAMDQIADQMTARLKSAVRPNDVSGHIAPDKFGLCLMPQTTVDLEICLETSRRLSQILSEPYSIDGTVIYLTVSIGFCQLGREDADGSYAQRDAVMICARDALREAAAVAPAAVRAYNRKSGSSGVGSNGVKTKSTGPASTSEGLDPVEALDKGEIIPWFQPQVSTDTGKITGFEALARWVHPDHGVIPPAKFLPQLHAANRMARLSEVMLYHGMTALRAWEQAEREAFQIAVNFSEAELNDPKLVEKVSWELDRFEVEPHRLVVEILENVMSQGPDDVTTRNAAGLSAMGCQIDLDDFGTGNASLNAIKRFRVNRIKIDRSFVTKCDRDPEQQRMIRAILTLAEKLDLETLAEGVETVGEHSLLAQLGCSHVQGFGIARPLPFEKTLDWIRAHNAKLEDPPDFSSRAG